MKIAAGIGTEPIGRPQQPSAVVDEAVRAEAEGYSSAWVTHFARGIETLSTVGCAAAATTYIELGIGVIPTYPRHPLALAQQASTVQALAGGRLTLGIGVSHRPVIEKMFGLGYTRPAAHMRAYLQVLVPMLAEGKVSHHGEFFDVEAEINVPGTAPVPVVVGALSPGMLRVAGELADGVVTWLVGPGSLEDHVVPTVSTAAEEAGRPSPRVVAALPVTISDDRDEGRERADDVFARYAGLVNYQRAFERQGASSPADLAIIGNEDQVSEQIRAVAATGVTELWPVVFPVGDNEARTRALLASLAPEME